MILLMYLLDVIAHEASLSESLNDFCYLLVKSMINLNILIVPPVATCYDLVSCGLLRHFDQLQTG